MAYSSANIDINEINRTMTDTENKEDKGNESKLDIFKAKVEYLELGTLEGQRYRLRIPTISEMAYVESISPQDVSKGHRSAWLLIICAEKQTDEKWIKAFDTTQLDSILKAQIGSPISGIMVEVDKACLKLFSEVATGFIPIKENPNAKKSQTDQRPGES